MEPLCVVGDLVPSNLIRPLSSYICWFVPIFRPSRHRFAAGELRPEQLNAPHGARPRQ